MFARHRIGPLLTAAGPRSLRADLLGHGYSDRPVLRYDRDLFVRQLTEQLESLAALAPDARRHEVAGAAHALTRTVPDRVAPVLIAFCRRRG